MKLRNFFTLLCTAVVATLTTSCLSDSDSSAYTMSGVDFANIAGYSDTRVYFSITAGDGSTVSAFSEIDSKMDKEDYPVDSRCYITYNYTPTVNKTDLLKLKLLSIRPVTTITATEGDVNDCKLGDETLSVSWCKLAGTYINIVTTVPTGENRTWDCYIHPEDSNNSEAHLYLVTKADKEGLTGETVCLSINVASIKTADKELHVHINDQYQKDHVVVLNKK